MEPNGPEPRALHRNGRRHVLVVEDAQLARPTLLEENRLLMNHEDRLDKPLRVLPVICASGRLFSEAMAGEAERQA